MSNIDVIKYVPSSCIAIPNNPTFKTSPETALQLSLLAKPESMHVLQQFASFNQLWHTPHVKLFAHSQLPTAIYA